MLPLSLAILAVGAVSPRDGIAPLRPGQAQAGSRFDLVLRPQEEGCRLLLSDAESDAPVDAAKLTTKQFGKAGSTPVEGSAVAGLYGGHYLAACVGADSALVVEASASSRLDLFTFEAPPEAPAAPEKKAKTASIPMLAGIGLLLAAFVRRLLPQVPRGRRFLVLPLLCFLTAGDAAAHGVDEAGLPIAPGSELSLGQEIQFALGLRTARVTVASFPPPESLPNAAPRSSPSVPRSAVVERDGKKLVFVRLAPERFVAREVTLGWSSGGSSGQGSGTDVAVESGLMPGDLAVVAGGAFLRNGGANGGASP